MMGKRYRRYRRRPLRRLLPFLMLAALCLCMFPAAAQDDSSDFVGSFDLQEIFQGNPLAIDENNILFSDPLNNRDKWVVPTWNSRAMQQNSSVESIREVSMKSSWQLVVDYTLDNQSSVINSRADINLTGSRGTLAIEVGYTDDDGPWMYMRHWSGGRWDTTYGRRKLSASQVSQTKPLILTFDAATGKLTLQYGQDGALQISTTAAACPYLQTDTASISISGVMSWFQSDPVPTGTISAKFNSIRYTKYTSKFVETTVLNSAGQPMTDDEKKQVHDGDIITIQAEVKNTFADGDPVPVHLKLSDNEDLATTGLDFDDTGWENETQRVTVDSVEVADVNITGPGIPLSCKPGGTLVTYRAKVVNPDNGAVTVGQMIEDDFFLSKQYSGTELVPAQPLVPYDPDKTDQSTPGSDYHYSRLPAANANGWNNTPVELSFYPGDFDRFVVQEQRGDQLVLDSGNTRHQYTDEQVTCPVEMWAESLSSGSISVKKTDDIRIDRTAPKLSASGNTITLTDNLSGVWKLQKKQSNGSFADLETFALSADGIGAASQNYTILQNGVYRVVDTAGNAGAATALSPYGPPVVTRPDPSDGSDPIGPVLDTDQTLPGPTVTTDADTGLNHGAITENIFEYIDEQTPLYGGRFTAAHAQALMDYRYSVTTDLPGGLTASLTVIKDGVDVTAQGVDTTRPGSFTIRYVATDPQGNTTTILLTDTLVDRRKPPVVVYPDEKDPPVGPPIDPNKTLPDPVVTTDPDTGYRHALITDEVTETITRAPALYGGRIDRQTAQALLTGRFDIRSAQPDGTLSLLGLQILAADGRDITALGIDTTVPGDYLLRYSVADSQGNRTTVEFTYHLVKNPNDPTGQITHTVDPFDGTESGAGQNGSSVDTGLGGNGAAADCRLHWLALLAAAATMGYTLLRRRRTSWLPDILFFGALAGLCAVLWPLSRCLLDHSSLLAYAGALLVCWAARLRALTAPTKSPQNK
ncbi:Uncharacterised protein [Anaerotruncus sp. 2789STDY5834896]|uniref:Uncharacterized protein n=1 Tax=uncultured Anaerotruncus sp. TaxID=905011 RepID=A0A1C6J5E1_9FIRM|nr:Uncharacterised protein [uncultured Anaerotruncus sp.]